ncbi:MAG: RHS repeat-associated core domain-containing protein [Candidatus Acidiferrales bacterium]
MKRLFPVLLTFFFAATTWAQGTGTGFPMYGSFESGVFDTTNRYNLNSNFSIPIVSSQGRGLNLNFALAYNSLLWKISSGAWVSVTDPTGNPLWGWMKISPNGMITNTTTQAGSCKMSGDGLVDYDSYSNYVYYDGAGTGHPFPLSWYYNPCMNQYSGTTAGSATDGSGYYYNAKTGSLLDKSGAQISVGSKMTDTNGNYASASVNGSETDWTDSAGHLALKIISGTGNIQYEVLDPNGNYQTTTATLTSYNIKTNFGCSGVTEHTGTASLPSTISVPTGLSYTIAYEATPGNSGYYTGRVSKVTLPNGGYVQFQYGSTNDGIDCTDGTVLSLTRTQNDGTTSSIWTFSRAPSGSNWVTTVTAPQMSYDSAANQSVFTFNSSGQETSRQIYQGSSSSGTLLRTINTTWASNGSPATKTTILENNQQSQVATNFDSNGNLLSSSEYDYGSGAPGGVLRTTTNTPLSTSAYTSLNILDRVITKTIADSTGTVQYREDTAYDGNPLTSCPTGASQHNDTGFGCSNTTRGNPSSVTKYTTASTQSGGVTHNSYYDGFGNLAQADINCCQSKTWSYSTTTQYSRPDSETCGTSGGPQLTTSHTYSSYTGHVLTETDPNTQITKHTYDFIKRKLTDTRPDNAQTTYTYNDTQKNSAVSNPIQSPAMNTNTRNIDGLGRATTSTTADASNNVYTNTQQVYDPLGRVYQRSVPYLGSPQSYGTMQYDALGRVTKRTSPDGQQETMSYSGNTVTSTDQAGKQMKVQYDGAGRMISTFEPDVTNNNALTVQTSYTYTVLGEVATVTQGSQTRSFTYDGMGRLTSETTPEAGTTSYQYNSFDLVTQRTDARGVITTYTYDTLNRLTQVSYNVGTTGVAATPTVTYTYGTNANQNNNGRVITMTDGPGSESYTYEILGRLTQLQKVVNGTAYTISYSYNQAGSVTSVTYPSGKVINRSYDSIGRLSSIANGSSNLWSGLTYDPLFHLTGATYGNGVTETLGYSANRGQLTSLSYANSSGTIFGETYSYAQNGGNNGQLASITDSMDAGRNATYTYDAIGRVTVASTAGSTNYPAWGLSFGYDRYGNRLTQSISSGCTGITCPTNSVVVNTATNRITTTGYGYDANGNMTNDGVNTLTYDAENRLLTSSGSLGSGTYSYDGEGLRVVKISGSTTTVFSHSGTKVIAEYQNGAAPSSPTNEYFYSGNQIVASVQSGTTYYFHNDRHSLRVRTTSTGGIQDQRGTFPFGETWYTTASGAEWVFTNYQRDNESGNDYAYARQYVNRLGRFATGDPVEVTQTSAPRNFNRYSYVANDSINRTDPTGRLASYCGDPGPVNQGLNETDFGNPIWYPGFGSLEGDDSSDVPPDVEWMYCALPLENNYDNPPPDPCDQEISWAKTIITTYKNCGVENGPFQGWAWLYVGNNSQTPLSDQTYPNAATAAGFGGVYVLNVDEDDPFTLHVVYGFTSNHRKRFGINFGFAWTCHGNPKTAFLNVSFHCAGGI